MKLYGYFRSSAAYRVRIALNLKGLDHKHVHVHLHRHGGEHLQENYAAVNPQLLVPTLAVANGRGGEVALIQSLAILEYLDEVSSSRWRSWNTWTRSRPSRRSCRPTPWAVRGCAGWPRPWPARSIRCRTCGS
jgi:glutathione S-transferase